VPPSRPSCWPAPAPRPFTTRSRHVPWRWAFHVATGLAALVALGALWRRRYRLARAAAAVQTVLILLGWAASQYPFLVVPDVTLTSAAANPQTRLLLLVALGIGVPVLVPSLLVLFRVFKAARRA
jgi:cytochrome d ubiquinol oxidase subunit II